MNPWDIPALIGFAMAVRSAVYWMRRSAGTSAEDRPTLLALFVTARVLLWVTLAAWFELLAHGADAPGQAAHRFWWVPGVFFIFLALQTAVAFFLSSPSRRGDERR